MSLKGLLLEEVTFSDFLEEAGEYSDKQVTVDLENISSTVAVYSLIAISWSWLYCC